MNKDPMAAGEEAAERLLCSVPFDADRLAEAGKAMDDLNRALSRLARAGIPRTAIVAFVQAWERAHR